MERGTFCRGGYRNLAVVARVMNNGEWWSFINFTLGKKFFFGLKSAVLGSFKYTPTGYDSGLDVRSVWVLNMKLISLITMKVNAPANQPNYACVMWTGRIR